MHLALNNVAKRYAQVEHEALPVLYGLQKMGAYIKAFTLQLGVFTKTTQSIRVERSP